MTGRKHTAIHEARHAVAAIWLGMRIAQIEFCTDTASNWRARIHLDRTSLDNLTDAQQRLTHFNRIVAAFAPIVADEVNSASEEYRRDQVIIKVLLREHFAANIDNTRAQARRKAQAILQEEKAVRAITALADEIYNHHLNVPLDQKPPVNGHRIHQIVDPILK